ncbi:MAG TPA: hypothetical protein VMU24_00585 [Candidatus Acidoferrales bacterium]|nr:hypothetical protein [Candidatus Acidoferrales bacterium]
MNRVSVLLLSCSLCFAGTALAQQTPTQDFQQDIRAGLRELSDSLRETRAELSQARAEVRALREEIGHLREAQSQHNSQATAATLSDRVAVVEENQRVLQSRVEQHDQTKVETASKFKLKLDGMVLFNAGMNRGEVDSIDVPNLAVPPVPGQNAGSVFGTLRQSLIGLQVIGPDIGGARTTAELQFDFFGGFPSELEGVTMGLVRMRVARAEMRWDKWSLRFGQDHPLMTPNSPTSLASLGIPSMGFSGNLWTWTPQIVGERRWKTGEQSGAKLEFGVLDPFDGEAPPTYQFERQPEASERSRKPAFAVRQSWARGSGTRTAEIGAGAYVAQQDYGYGRTVTAWAGTLDWNVPLPKKFALSGEFFRGRALGGMWGGIGQSVVFSGEPSLPTSTVQPINTIGGWSQLKYAPTSKLEFNGVFGMDNPFAADLRSGSGEYSAIFQNRTEMVNVIEHLRSNVLLSLEYRHIRTEFASRAQTAEHVNLGFGVQF